MHRHQTIRTLDIKVHQQSAENAAAEIGHSRVGQLDFDFWKVFIQCFKSHLILMLKSFVQLTIPVSFPCLHILNIKTLQIISAA